MLRRYDVALSLLPVNWAGAALLVWRHPLAALMARAAALEPKLAS